MNKALDIGNSDLPCKRQRRGKLPVREPVLFPDAAAGRTVERVDSPLLIAQEGIACIDADAVQ